MNFVYFAILIGALIFFHELGHFLAAKGFGVKVLKFALGFGRPIVSFRWGETTYSINWFPLGGYVRMLGQEPAELTPDEEPDPEHAGDMHRAFDRKPRWQRMIIILAGPVFNLILPLPIYFFFLFSQATLLPATVGATIPGQRADRAGIQAGDRIVEIDGQPIRYWEEMEALVSAAPEQELQIVVERKGFRRKLSVTPASVMDAQRIAALSEEKGRIGVVAAFLGSQLGISDPDGPAARAGLETWDVVVSAAGQSVRRWMELEEILARHAGQPIELTLRRLGPEEEIPENPDALFEGGDRLTRTLLVPPAGTPEAAGMAPAEFFLTQVTEGSAAEKAGLRRGDRILRVDDEPCATFQLCFRHFQSAPEEPHRILFHRPGEPSPREVSYSADIERRLNDVKEEEIHAQVGVQARSFLLSPEGVPNEIRLSRAVRGAFARDWQMIRLNALGLVALVTGQVSARSVGGPIMIFDLTSKAAERGAEPFFWLMAVISINLGLINLLPIPILDGGQFVFLTVETVLRGPISMKARMIAAYIGLALVVFLMVFAAWNDVQRYWEDFVGFFQ